MHFAYLWLKDPQFSASYSKSSSEDSGLDLFMPNREIVVPARAISFPINLETRIALYKEDIRIPFLLVPRSSTGSRTPLRLANSIGVIDKFYTGDLIALVDNISDKDFVISPQSRLFQIMAPNMKPITVTKTYNSLEEFLTKFSKGQRGEAGLGSTGI